MGDKNIHTSHRRRMREKFDKIGFWGWSDYEIMEYMLYNVYRQGDTNHIAHRLLEFGGGSVVNVMNNTTDFRIAEQVDGVGEQTVRFLRTLREFVKYYKNEEIKYKPVQFDRESFFDIINLVGFQPQKESILLICTDTLLNVKCVVDITEQSGDVYAITTPERALKTALMNEAKCVFMAHNHPDGSLGISLNDIAITNKMDGMFANVGIAFIDHYIVGYGMARSIKQYIVKSELETGMPLYDDLVFKV